MCNTCKQHINTVFFKKTKKEKKKKKKRKKKQNPTTHMKHHDICERKKKKRVHAHTYTYVQRIWKKSVRDGGDTRNINYIYDVFVVWVST